MAVLKIARMGQPVLRRSAVPVADPTAPEVRVLAQDMIETMHEAAGTGLAAPQVFDGRRVIVFFVDSARAAREGPESAGDTAAVPVTVLVNPDFEPLDDEMVTAWEACLSLPGLAGKVPRHRRIRYWGQDLDGREVVRTAEGFHARVVQHECDHLDGVLFVDRMADLATLSFTSEMRATGEEAETCATPDAARDVETA